MVFFLLLFSCYSLRDCCYHENQKMTDESTKSPNYQFSGLQAFKIEIINSFKKAYTILGSPRLRFSTYFVRKPALNPIQALWMLKEQPKTRFRPQIKNQLIETDQQSNIPNAVHVELPTHWNVTNLYSLIDNYWLPQLVLKKNQKYNFCRFHLNF